MAVAINSGMRTIFDGSYTERLNVSEFIDAIDPRDTPLLAMLGWGTEAGTSSAGSNTLAFPCTNTTHTWQNDQLVPAKGTLGGAYTSGGGTLTFATGQGSYVKINDYILVNDVHYVVTAISTDAVDVSVVEGSADANHANGDTWYNLGTLRADGAAFTTTYLSTDLSSTSNYTQIFHEAVSVSGTSMATEKFGIADEFDREFAKKFQEVVIRLEQAAHYGRANALPANNAGAATTFRRFGGLYEFIRQGSGANVTNGSGNLLTEKTLVDLLEDIWEDGGKPDKILVNSTQKRVMNSFISPYVRTDRSETTAGVIVGTYHSDFGDIDIVLDRYVRPTDLIVIQSEYIGIGPLAGNGMDRSFFVTPVPPDGDRQIATITGEYTMEVRNGTTAHGWLHNLSTTLV